MRVLTHDLPEEQFQRMKIESDTVVIRADGAFAPCRGQVLV